MSHGNKGLYSQVHQGTTSQLVLAKAQGAVYSWHPDNAETLLTGLLKLHYLRFEIHSTNSPSAIKAGTRLGHIQGYRDFSQPQQESICAVGCQSCIQTGISSWNIHASS